MERFDVRKLPMVDQSLIRRGKCPWCVVPLAPGGIDEKQPDDKCPECGDEFYGALPLND